ncbi:LPXTG cell wall anchor domain-containing protein [Listeria grandensis]|uniref:LPXTG cell wall anchor domain-containing protein n=1 Tax=Listeria grandensis TaxID=1494963 RepID=UPI00164CF853|nr:LPXTG cell wall anchor domain-containing protein [Listeria grandensis]MBC6314448.1 LPXTG cell wall anchor domain-containing protein [Listeria grandensis]
MTNRSTKLACGLLACGLTLSLATPVFAEEEVKTPVTYADPATPETKDAAPVQLAATALTPNANITFVKDATTTPADFVTIQETGTTLTFKAGTEAKTAVAGTFQTTIIATFADTTTQEIVADYTVTEPAKAPVKAAAALATAKANVTTEINVAVKDPSKFVTATSGVTLSFAKAPAVNRIGAQTVTVVATDGTTTENIIVNYTVVDTTKPVIDVYDNNFYVSADEEWYADELVDATDNSGFVKLYFANGQETLDTSKEGKQTVEIIAEDASGNTASATLTYTVVGEDFYFFDAPVVNVAKTTATDVFGTAEPLTTVVILSEDGVSLGQSDADENGNFHIKLGTPLVTGQTVFLGSFDMDTGEFSDLAEFTFQGGTLKVDPVENAEKPSITQVVKKAPIKVATVAKTTNLKSLPKTGDESTSGLVFAGLLISGIAVAVLRKRS